MKFFKYDHLSDDKKKISAPFGELAKFIESLPENAEKQTALRKLLEAKDCAVRSVIPEEPE